MPNNQNARFDFWRGVAHYLGRTVRAVRRWEKLESLPRAVLSIQELPSVVVQLFERAPQPLLPGVQGQLGLFVRYLRRKPGRGLAVICNAGALNAPRGTRGSAPKRWVSVTLGEGALAGTQIRFAARQAQKAALEVQPPGILQFADLGLLVQAFPADNGLPALAASCTTTPDGPLASALEAAARVQLCDPTWHLVSANAEPVRYKPSSRCVYATVSCLREPWRKERLSGTWRSLVRCTAILSRHARSRQRCSNSTQSRRRQVSPSFHARSAPWRRSDLRSTRLYSRLRGQNRRHCAQVYAPSSLASYGESAARSSMWSSPVKSCALRRMPWHVCTPAQSDLREPRARGLKRRSGHASGPHRSPPTARPRRKRHRDSRSGWRRAWRRFSPTPIARRMVDSRPASCSSIVSGFLS